MVQKTRNLDACPSFRQQLSCEPPEWEWLSLSEALTWIAFYNSMDNQRLSGLLAMVPDRERTAARMELNAAAHRLLELGRIGKIQMTGKFISSPDVSLAAAQRCLIPAREFKEYLKYEVDCDGLRRWLGHIVNWTSEPLSELSYDEIYCLVEVHRASLITEFPPLPVKMLSNEEVIEWCASFINEGHGNGMDKAWNTFQHHPRRMGMSRESLRKYWRHVKNGEPL